MNITSIGIIGHGDFGRFLQRLAKDRLPHVVVKVYSSRKVPDGVEFFSFEDVCKTDMLFPCVPIAAFADTIDRILPHLGERTIVCDVATIKTHTVSVLQSKNVPHFIATHPMFGPHSYAKHGDSLIGLRVAVCDSSLSTEDNAQVIAFLKETGFVVLEMTPDEHDKLVAETLFLTHFIGQSVHQAGFDRTAVDTISFGYLMDAVESVIHDAALFHDVYKYNPHCKEVIERFETVQKQLVASLESSGNAK